MIKITRGKDLQPSIDEHIAHIERLERHPIVASALVQRSTFTGKVKNFYDLQVYGLRDRDPQKEGMCPQDLVEILGPFSKKTFNPSELEYDSVREAYQHCYGIGRRLKRVGSGLGMFVAGVGSGISGSAGNYEIAVPIGVVAVGLTVAHLWETTPNSFKEYGKLHKSAERADYFIQQNYIPHFIQRTLGTQQF